MTNPEAGDAGCLAGADVETINRREADALCTWLVTSNGCMAARVLPDGSVAALQDLLFTRAIVLGCAGGGWAQRFCFEDRGLADRRFAELEGEDDVPAGHVAIRQGVRFAAPQRQGRRYG